MPRLTVLVQKIAPKGKYSCMSERTLLHSIARFIFSISIIISIIDVTTSIYCRQFLAGFSRVIWLHTKRTETVVTFGAGSKINGKAPNQVSTAFAWTVHNVRHSRQTLLQQQSIILRKLGCSCKLFHLRFKKWIRFLCWKYNFIFGKEFIPILFGH